MISRHLFRNSSIDLTSPTVPDYCAAFFISTCLAPMFPLSYNPELGVSTLTSLDLSQSTDYCAMAISSGKFLVPSSSSSLFPSVFVLSVFCSFRVQGRDLVHSFVSKARLIRAHYIHFLSRFPLLRLYSECHSLPLSASSASWLHRLQHSGDCHVQLLSWLKEPTL